MHNIVKFLGILNFAFGISLCSSSSSYVGQHASKVFKLFSFIASLIVYVYINCTAGVKRCHGA